MQVRHKDNNIYFNELAHSCREYFIPYLETKTPIDNKNVLEIGCGMGGNLYPFFERNCNIVGVDIDCIRIEFANNHFKSLKNGNNTYEFRCENFFDTPAIRKFEIVIVHDVIEHINDKDGFFNKLKKFVTDDSIIYFGFPAWHMPFGGHQQLCNSIIGSKIPFIHLLPTNIYKRLLKSFNEDNHKIEELLDIKNCRMTIENFERITLRKHYKIIDRCLWFINPHYKIKFNLPPIKLPKLLASIPYIRNYYTSSCFYLVQNNPV